MRSYSGEQIWNIATHAIGVPLAAVGLYYMADKATAQPLLTQFACWLFCGAFVAMYAISTRYHMARDPESASWWNSLDRSAIFFTVAASATAQILLIPGIAHERMIWGSKAPQLALALVWFIGTLGALRELILGKRLEWMAAVFFILQGVAIALAIEVTAFQYMAMLLVMAGVVVYLIGAFRYFGEEKKYSHGWWHLCVLLASALHYAALWITV
jgi:hemolysin III